MKKVSELVIWTLLFMAASGMAAFCLLLGLVVMLGRVIK